MSLERNQIFKSGGTIGWGFYSFFFLILFFFFSIHRLDKREGQKKKVNLLHQPAKETGCLSGQLYIRVLDSP